MTPAAGDAALLLDMEGRIVHRWVFREIRPSYGRLLSNGHLLMRGTDRSLPPPEPHDPKKPPLPLEQRVRGLGGNSTHLVEVDWEGKVVWEYRNEFSHHDFVRLPNGHTLFPVWVELPEELGRKVRGGMRRPREKLPPMLGDDLLEINPACEEVGRIETWKLFDPRRDPIGPLEQRWEWTHVNSLDVNEKGDIVFSCRQNSRVGIIDAESRELVWKYGYPDTHWQHCATWVSGGNVQIFDNGRMGSRVIEVDPETRKVVWSYSGRPAQQFYSGHISGAQRLPTGAVLVCEGSSGRVFEVTRDHEVVWEWINPFVNTDPRGQPVVSIFRAHRYTRDHPALREHSLDPAAHAELNRLHGLEPV